MELSENKPLPTLSETTAVNIESAVANSAPLSSGIPAEVKETKPAINASLSLITQYVSSSDSSSDSSSEGESDSTDESSSEDDDVVQVLPKTTTTTAIPSGPYRNPNAVVEVESDSSSSESEVETMNVEEVDSETEIETGRGNKKPTPLKVRGELLPSDLPPIEDLRITVPENECIELGKVMSIVDQIVLVDSLPGHAPLNIDTVLFLDKGATTLGKIFDVIGQVADPIYCVLFNSNAEIVSKGVMVGTKVFCAPRTEHTSFIILSDLMKNKGSDASWKDDCEPPDRFLDYSDDEQERSARKARKGYVNNTHENTEDEGAKRQRPQRMLPPRRNFAPQQVQPIKREPSDNSSWHYNYNPPRVQHPAPAFINPFACTSSAPLLFNPFAAPPPPPPPPPSQ